MTRTEILEDISKYFKARELVCDHIYAKWGENSWRFLDTDFLHALLVIRKDILGAPMFCNTSSATQRGMRCNCCKLVRDKKNVYLSAHVLGKGGDFTVFGMTAEQARQKIKAYSHLLPFSIRIESKVSWLHFDVVTQSSNIKKIEEFNA